MQFNPRRRDLLLTLGFSALYWASAQIGLFFADVGPITIVWPPTGLALVILLLFGLRFWPAIALGALVTEAGTGVPLAVATGMALGNTLEAVIGAWALRKVGFSHTLAHPRDVWMLVLLGAGLSTWFSAIIGVASLLAGGVLPPDTALQATLSWWMGDALSNLVFAPLLLAYSERPHFTLPRERVRFLEGLLLLVLTVVGGLMVFFEALLPENTPPPMAFTMFIFAVWAALRFHQRGATLFTGIIAGMALWGHVLELGYFGAAASGGLLHYWTFVMVLAATSLFIASSYGGRLQEAKIHKETEAEHQDLVESVQAIIWRSLPDGRFTYVSREAEAVLGYPLQAWLDSPTFWTDHMHPDDLAWAPAYCAAESSKLATHRFEYRMLAADGRVVWLEDIVRVIPDAHGKPVELVGVMLDISGRKEAENRLKLSRQVFDNAVEGVLITDHKQVILEANPGVQRITGYSREELLGHTPSILVSGRHGEHFYREMWQEIAESGQWTGEIWNRRKNGEIYPEWLSISAVKDDLGNIQNYVAVFSDITLRKESEAQLVYLANHDALTSLPNRTLLQERIEQALLRAQRHKSRIAVLFVDLDRFKVINDTLGHHVGDLLLQEGAERLRRCLRESDTVARQGGDEFVVLVEEFADTQYLGSVATKILDAFAHSFQLMGQELHVSASVGIAVYPEDGEDLHTLLKHADIAMYRAKDQGKNTFQFYKAETNLHSFERLALESSLRRALERNEFLVHYQPKVDLQTEEIIGAEALLRWNHPDMGLVPPNQFIPLAEETGLIIPIGAWVLKEVCRQNRAWQNAGLPLINVAVNISARQFRDESLPDSIADALAVSGLSPAYLGLEITESMIMQQVELASKVLQRFHDMGAHVSIDDFGTGYSSLGYLKRFPIDLIKVDQSFVRDIHHDDDDAAITKAIIAMAHGLQLKVVAEGVENAAQLAFLHEHGCDQVQGYFYSKPLPAAEFAELLETGTMRGRTQAVAQLV